MTENKEYHIDLVRVNSKMPFHSLRKNLPYDDLKTECDYFDILPAFPIANQHGYQSRIEFTVPSKNFFNILSKSHLGSYSISHLEIAEDTIFDNKNDAQDAIRKLFVTLRKKYSNTNFIFDRYYSVKGNRSSKHRGVFGEEMGKFKSQNAFGDLTGYYGQNKNFMFRIYTRFSKINGKPCIHAEWVMKSAALIRTKTGIRKIPDFLEFNLEEFYKRQFEKQITHDEIDKFKLGKWCRNLNSRKRKFLEKDMYRIGFNANLFCRKNRIETYTELVTWFKREKDRIKSKPGRSSEYDTKIINTDPNKFRIPVDPKKNG